MASCSENFTILNYIEENKFFTVLTSFTFAVIFLFIYILNVYTFFDKRRIPRAVRATAPFGNIKDVLFQDTTLYLYLWKYYNKFKRKKCKYGGLFMFFKPAVLIVDREIMKRISSCQLNMNHVNTKRNLPHNKVVDFFSDHYFEVYLEENTRFKTLLTEKYAKEKDLSTAMYFFFLETTSSAFGFDINENLIDNKVESSFMYYFNLVHRSKKSLKGSPVFLDIIYEIETRKKNDVREKDLLQAFVDLFNEGTFAMEDVVQEMLDIFTDNVIYSYCLSIFTLYELASNTDIQGKLTEEIRKFNKENETLKLKNVQDLTYLDAVVKETLRKYPPIPTVIKKCEKNFHVDDALELPQGSIIFYSILGIHRDPKNFPEPEEFDPLRFHNNEVELKNFVPFGFEAGNEIGLKFTTLHVKLALINVFTSYRVNLHSTASLDFDNTKLPMYPKEPLPVILGPMNRE